jgi:D-alanine transaminase
VIVYLQGELVPAEQARVSVFDRGFIFGDGIYEGLRSVVVNGRRRVVGLRRHAERLRAGLAAARIEWDCAQLAGVCDRLLDANGLDDAFIYLQITRGTPRLDGQDPVRSRLPPAGLKPGVFAYCTPVPALEHFTLPPRKAAGVQEDLRWRMGRVKSISLLGNVLAAMGAGDHGADEAILVRDGLVSEGTYTNVALVLPRAGRAGGGAPGDFEIVTPSPESVPFLDGITRQIILAESPEIVQRPVRAEELLKAQEIMLWGTTTMVSSVVSLDGRSVGNGSPGPVARALLDRLVACIRAGRDDTPPTTPHA